MENSQLSSWTLPETPQWIEKEAYPYSGRIVSVMPVKGKFGKDDVRLELSGINGIRSFDVWGANLSFMKYHCGNIPVNWVGKTIQIELQGVKRVIFKISE